MNHFYVGLVVQSTLKEVGKEDDDDSSYNSSDSDNHNSNNSVMANLAVWHKSFL